MIDINSLLVQFPLLISVKEQDFAELDLVCSFPVRECHLHVACSLRLLEGKLLDLPSHLVIEVNLATQNGHSLATNLEFNVKIVGVSVGAVVG